MQRLVLAVVCSGALAGGVLFVVQHLAIGPLIAQAEAYEHDASDAHAEGAQHEWEPAAGVERTVYTAIGTVLTGIAFAAILLGAAVASGMTLDLRYGVVLGAIGFAAFVVAPSLGLPPKPPGVPGADVAAAQAWWVGTAAATLVGLMAIGRSPRSQWAWGVGLLLLVLPHLIGAPVAEPSTLIPAELSTRFAWTSVVTRLPFWLVLGAIGGHLLGPTAERRPA